MLLRTSCLFLPVPKIENNYLYITIVMLLRTSCLFLPVVAQATAELEVAAKDCNAPQNFLSISSFG
jgi:hypothetical protein